MNPPSTNTCRGETATTPAGRPDRDAPGAGVEQAGRRTRRSRRTTRRPPPAGPGRRRASRASHAESDHRSCRRVVDGDDREAEAGLDRDEAPRAVEVVDVDREVAPGRAEAQSRPLGARAVDEHGDVVRGDDRPAVDHDAVDGAAAEPERRRGDRREGRQRRRVVRGPAGRRRGAGRGCASSVTSSPGTAATTSPVAASSSSTPAPPRAETTTSPPGPTASRRRPSRSDAVHQRAAVDRVEGHDHLPAVQLAHDGDDGRRRRRGARPRTPWAGDPPSGRCRRRRRGRGRRCRAPRRAARGRHSRATSPTSKPASVTDQRRSRSVGKSSGSAARRADTPATAAPSPAAPRPRRPTATSGRGRGAIACGYPHDPTKPGRHSASGSGPRMPGRYAAARSAPGRRGRCDAWSRSGRGAVRRAAPAAAVDDLVRRPPPPRRRAPEPSAPVSSAPDGGVGSAGTA